MRYPTLILALAGASMLTGCSSLVSLHPFITASQGTTDARLAGSWKGTDADDKEAISFDQSGSTYKIKFTGDDGQPVNFEGHLTWVGPAEFLDVISTDDDATGIRVHMLVRLWLTDNTLRWTFLDSDWIRDQARRGLEAQDVDGRTLITLEGDKLFQFLKSFGPDDHAYSDAAELVRVAK